jgi:signal transduction histidine kinase/HAMP domain-containing protein
MSLIFSLFQDTFPVLLLPPDVWGWLGWLLFVALVAVMTWNWKEYQAYWDSRSWGLFIGFSLLGLVANAFLGIRFSAGSGLPIPRVAFELGGPALMYFGALAWMLAGASLGPFGAAIVGFLGGLIRYAWDSHSIFTPFEIALLGILFSAAMRQRYRTWAFRLLREPLLAALTLSILYSPVFIVNAFLAASGSVAERLDYALTRAPASLAAMSGEMLVGGLILQVLVIAAPALWGRRTPLQPSPAERSLEARFLFGTGSLISILLVALLVGDWLVAGNAARQMLQNRLKGTADLASQSVPFFLETGQSLAAQFAANPAVFSSTGAELSSELGQQMRSVPYFDQLIVFDASGQVIGNYPSAAALELSLYPEETAGVQIAFSGVLSQTYTIPPAQAGQPARVSFVIGLPDVQTGRAIRVLVARTNLETNPFTQPLLNSLKGIADPGLQGQGILLDEKGRILYHPEASRVMSQYPGLTSAKTAFFDDTASDGTRNLVYYQPALGRSWAVVLTVPAQRAQELALDIAAPLSLMILVLALIALLSLRFGLKTVTSSMQTLANEAVRIAQGQLDHSLVVEGVDEVGQLRRAFEQMRVSLQARLEELNRLLLVSQGVASSLEMRDAVQPVMEAVLATGASAVRVVVSLASTRDSEQDSPAVFALGPAQGKYAYLDEQIIDLVQQQERLVLTNTGRARGLDFSKGISAPSSLIAFPLRYENRYYGTIWAAYDQPRLFSESDVRFLTTLAGQAALAASNNHLFLSAEVGRQRLAAILASSPDPVLVTDYLNRLLLANPAAWQVLGGAIGSGEGQPIERLVNQKPLLDILLATSPEKLSAEVVLPNGQVYLATASPVVADTRSVGRVCILRDVTHFKELDTMKTEFVNTVSHDLRSPLTLMRGYATMLEMVGELNEQQQGYIKKMITGVENMSRLVNNLLDLGRIDVGVGLQLEMTPLLDIAERVTGLLEPQASQKNIQLNVELPQHTSPLVQADPALLQQAMYNLVENAIKYTPQDGRVRVRLKVVGDSMLFEVQDTGIGIAPIDQPRLFEKFYRGGQREAREQKGSGLGLAIVKSIAERHGGKVWLESQLGRGSTFFLQVPLRQEKQA